MKRFFAVIGLCLLAVNAQAQQRIEAMPPQSVPSAATPADTLRDFMRAEEARTCAELKSFARDTILRDDAFVRAANSRNTRAVAAAASKFASILANTLDTDCVLPPEYAVFRARERQSLPRTHAFVVRSG